ncbi:glycosyltransferase family 39 protein [Chryseobacterium koreense]|uniref:Glycosyltransferase RgtA/B/C/D-like domain-containing protein n=1 Tax=Chryseobacterium koreense CCUG 49689 TaxID=1304281 RepID=A0A0J7IZW7_9FLAO|nr:glycosyltransferase family 39 protein [Chryseobacterium koreense]KMQ71748.1 hypothetical protein ACM44_05910 [Chryseobacterium koreense CCUG 49689]MBB5334228.1 hypothetical protein [Chryseobacterium koreense]
MKRHLILLLLIFTTITGGYFFWSWSLLPDGERFIYPLDDAYIHLAIAKNFALNGAWSINSTGFDSASSSILYTLLLSTLIKIFGVWEFYPLIINIIAGYLAVYWFYRYFRDFYSKSEMVWAVILLLPFSLLYAMTLIGMEHTIHMFLMVLGVYWIRKNVDSNFERRDFIKLLIIVFFISIVRFESIFFTAALAFALLLRKDFLKGLIISVVGFLPILVFGLISLKNGGYFFPNSVLIKGNVPGGTGILEKGFTMVKDGILLNRSFYKCLFFPLVLILIDLVRKYRSGKLSDFFRKETLVIAIVLMALMHSVFAILKYRYENYVMISMLMIIVPILAAFFKKIKSERRKITVENTLMAFGVAGIFAASVYRFQYMHHPSVIGSKNIYEQQVELSEFLRKNYRGEKIIANDIGAISYFSGVKLLDMVGLGSTAVTQFMVEHKKLDQERYTKEFRLFLMNYAGANDFKIAVIYPEWFPGKTPSTWIPVASWTVPDNRVAARNRVVFYALRPEEVQNLQMKLMGFPRDKNVVQWFYIRK